MNVENHKKVIEYIREHPEQWDQSYWHHPCKTAHCYAGIAQILSGCSPHGVHAQRDAMKWLDLTLHEATVAFHSGNSLERLEELPSIFTYDNLGLNKYSCDKYGIYYER